MDHGPYWIRIQELCGSRSTHVNCKKKDKKRQKKYYEYNINSPFKVLSDADFFFYHMVVFKTDLLKKIVLSKIIINFFFSNFLTTLNPDPYLA